MRIYIRHGEKVYKNGKSDQFKYDPSLTYEATSNAMDVAEELIKLYGIPKYILTSPYIRTRETALAMLKVVQSHVDTNIPVKICIELSCFLKFPNISKDDFREKTIIFEPPINEDYHSFIKRMKSHKEIHEYMDESLVPIWYVTHKTNIKKICSLNSYLCNEINFLDCIIFQGKRGTLSNCYKYSNREIEKIEFNISSGYKDKEKYKYNEPKKVIGLSKKLDDTGIILVD